VSVTPAPGWRALLRLVAWIADLRLAIGLLLLIALASGIGTAIPQQESTAFYHQRFDGAPWLGLLRADGLLRLQLDHVYSSGWFLALLAWLGLALLLCSWRRQWPALQASLRWIDYRQPRQLSKLSLAQTLNSGDAVADLDRLEANLRQRGWRVRRQEGRLAGRRGVAGRIGPLLVHAGMVLLMVGAAWGALAGQRLEQFLAPGRSLELTDSRGQTHLTVELEQFAIQRDPAGRPEQFSSDLRIQPPTPAGGETPPAERAQISVNHPLRTRGITLYQADWALAAVDLQLGRSPVLPLPLQPFPQLGEQVWGLVLPTRPDGSEPVLLSLSSEQGPAEVYDPDGNVLARLVPGGEPVEVRGIPIRLVGVLPASGILLKRDPGVPLVYAGFAVALLGGGLSLIATRQLWAVAEPGKLHLAGLCNRNLTAFAAELPGLLPPAPPAEPTVSGEGPPDPDPA
jgi:cytochrome c biogenesis protein